MSAKIRIKKNIILSNIFLLQTLFHSRFISEKKERCKQDNYFQEYREFNVPAAITILCDFHSAASDNPHYHYDFKIQSQITLNVLEN